MDGYINIAERQTFQPRPTRRKVESIALCPGEDKGELILHSCPEFNRRVAFCTFNFRLSSLVAKERSIISPLADSSKAILPIINRGGA